MKEQTSIRLIRLASSRPAKYLLQKTPDAPRRVFLCFLPAERVRYHGPSVIRI
jgi:hypothetical protein